MKYFLKHGSEVSFRHDSKKLIERGGKGYGSKTPIAARIYGGKTGST